MSEIEVFYRAVITLVPDWFMALLMLIAAAVCYRRYRIRRNIAVFALILPLLAFMGFYVWGVVFEPVSLARLAIGRAVSFGLALGIIAWGLLTNERNE